MTALHDLARTLIYLAVLASLTFLTVNDVVSGDAAVGLLGAIAGYAAGRVVNGAKGTNG